MMKYPSIIQLLRSPRWPKAVPQSKICKLNNDYQKKRRGDLIVNTMLSADIKPDSKFLDFGCGQGHVSWAAAETVKLSTGYDVIKRGNLKWGRVAKSSKQISKRNCFLTTNYNAIINRAPFDVILVYDVLDHLKSDLEVNVALSQIRQVAATNAKIIVRNHPWVARHGGHTYYKLNKAFSHLVLTNQQLTNFGCKPFLGKKTTQPIKTYRKWFADNGFKIEKQSPMIVETKVEGFFKQSRIKNAILNRCEGNPFTAMSFDFVDYNLRLV